MLGVLLCRCGGRINLKEVSDFVKEKVEVADKLCEKPGKLKKFAAKFDRAVVACGEKSKQPIIIDALVEAGAEFEIVDLREVAAQKAKLLVSAAIKKTRAKKIGLESLKPSLKRGAIRYEAVASIQKELCSKCGLCFEQCYHSAITQEIKINKAKCTGCGICIPACPTNAIKLQTHAPEVIDAEMQGLLLKEIALNPKIIMLTCSEVSIESCPLNVLPVNLPCAGMLSSFTILRAFDLGCDGVAIISCGDKCPHGASAAKIQSTVSLTQKILNSFGIAQERVQLCDTESVEEFVDRIKSMGFTPLRDKLPAVPENYQLAELLRSFADKLNAVPELILKNDDLPFGTVRADKRCTACGVCVSYCPAGALKLAADGSIVKLIFSYSKCSACRRCTEACPEKALAVDKIFDLARFAGQQDVTLVQDELISCEKCKKPFISKSMLQKISGLVQLETMKLCLECRSKI